MRYWRPKARPYLREALDGCQPTVLCQGKGNEVQGVCKGAHGILLHSWHLDTGVRWVRQSGLEQREAWHEPNQIWYDQLAGLQVQ